MGIANLIPAIVYITKDKHVHELALTDKWHDTDLTLAAGAPLADPDCTPNAYRRSDGVSTVIYIGYPDRHIYELRLEPQIKLAGMSLTSTFLTTNWARFIWLWKKLKPIWKLVGVWKWIDLTTITGAPLAAPHCPPFGYVRNDDISAILYLTDFLHIIELRRDNGWKWADLTAISGAPPTTCPPRGYVRSDGISTILFTDPGNNVCELRLDNGWKWADLTAIAGAPASWLFPKGYVRSDGISAVVYGDMNFHVIELRLDNGWKWTDLTAMTGAPDAYFLSGYVRSDGINAIVFSTGGGTYCVYEMRLDNGWQLFELTSVANAKPGVGPVGFVRADGISAVVYLSAPQHIYELRLENGWKWADLTALAASPIYYSNIWPYNRNSI